MIRLDDPALESARALLVEYLREIDEMAAKLKKPVLDMLMQLEAMYPPRYLLSPAEVDYMVANATIPPPTTA